MIQSLSAPLEMSLSLDEVKAFLKILSPREDRLLVHLIKTAEALVAERQGHYALTQRVRITGPLIHDRTRGLRPEARHFSHYPFITLPLHPIQLVERVEVFRLDGRRRLIEPRFWSLSHTRGPHRLTVKVADGDTLQADLRVGYGDTPEMVPLSLHHQILVKVAKLYEKSETLYGVLFPRQLGSS
jgi:uncharacterized phiE125 gp8 family phage protein